MKILLSTDGSEYSDGAARFLARFDFALADEITVLHVVHGRPFPHGGDTNYAALMQIGEEIAPGIVEITAETVNYKCPELSCKDMGKQNKRLQKHIQETGRHSGLEVQL